MMYGREAEQAALDRLLAEAADGRSRALVLHGEAGIGKSTLLDYIADRAATQGMPVLRGLGVETEAELPYATLHLMLHSYQQQFDRLPGPQAAALRAAFGMADLPTGDRFLVGIAVLTLLSDLAEDGPLVVLVDDAQWIDQSSAGALLFAARRLDAEGVVMVFAGRGSGPGGPDSRLAGLPELPVRRLDRTESAALLAGLQPELSPGVREQVVTEADGNPLALRELSAALTPEQRAGLRPAVAGTMAAGSGAAVGTDPAAGSGAPVDSGGSGAVGSGAVPTEYGTGLVRQAFLDRIRALPESAALLLLVAAADDTGHLAVLTSAAQRLGVGLDDLAPAEVSGLVRVADGAVSFRHPLIRSTAYDAAPIGRRLAVHRALADAFDARGDPDRRAWHLAASATGPDEAVASALERSAEQARVRGGYAAVAAAYQRAAELSPDPTHRVRRLAAAARAATAAGLPELAASLAGQAGPEAAEPLLRAELAMVRSALAHQQDDRTGGGELANAASAAAGQDPELAALLVLDAMAASWAANDLTATATVAEAVARMGEAAASHRFLASASAAATQLAGGELGQAVPHLRELLAELGGGNRSVWERAIVTCWYDLLVPYSTAHHEAVALVRDCRAEGAIGLLPRALMYLARVLLRLGRYVDACTNGGEGLRIAEDTNQPHFAAHLRGILACVAAIEGEQERCLELSDGLLAQGLTEKTGECLQALNLLDLGFGRHQEILTRWDRLAVGAARDTALGVVGTLPDYIEAAVRVGEVEMAAEPLHRLATWAESTEELSVAAVALRCQALLAPDPAAGELYEQAEKLHAREDQPFERARTALLHGEWLRRRRQRSAARHRLRTALETFESLGAAPWARRARSELRASGQALQSQDRGPGLLDRLTPQELQVVRLAAAGLSNRAIGAQLFLSPRTVGYHLYKAYPKLGVASRHELQRMDLG